MERNEDGVPTFITAEKWDLYLDLTEEAIRSYRGARHLEGAPVDTAPWAATERMAQDPVVATAVILCLLHHAAQS